MGILMDYENWAYLLESDESTYLVKKSLHEYSIKSLTGLTTLSEPTAPDAPLSDAVADGELDEQ